MISRLLEDETIEDSSLIFIGNLLFHFFPEIEPKIDLRIIELSVMRLFKTEMPALIKTLILMFSRLIILDQENLLVTLTNIKIEEKTALVYLLEKWLLNIDYFEENILKNIVFNALTNLIRKENKFFDNPYLTFISSEEAFEGNVFLKIFCCLIYALKKEIVLSQAEDGGNLKNDFTEKNLSDEIEVETKGLTDENDYDDLNYLDINFNFNLKVSLNKFKPLFIGLSDEFFYWDESTK